MPVNPVPKENIYGHRHRVEWLRDQLRPEQRVLEFGCGTGRMITLPLRAWGYDVHGIDLDAPSIEYGQQLLTEAGLDPAALSTTDLRDVGQQDVIIASEVLEHLRDDELHDCMGLIRDKLQPDGTLLITVPNGYSEFEFENLIWKITGAGRFYERARHGRLADAARKVKAKTGEWETLDHPMTVADSPHLQRHTWKSMHRLLDRYGFDVVDAQGAVLVCGPFSDLLLTGSVRAMRWNQTLGRRAGRLASDYYIVAKVR